MIDRIGRRRQLLAAGLLGLCLIPGGTAASSAAAGAGSTDRTAARTLVFLVRHAEKATGDPRDPPISEKGMRRAEALAKLLAEAGVTHLYATQYRRTHQTIEPLASAFGLEVQEFDALKPEEQVAAIRELPAGSIAVVAGHSNTIPHLVDLLGGEVSGLVDGPAGPMIRDEIYDRLFLVILPAAGDVSPDGRAQTVELRYGD